MDIYLVGGAVRDQLLGREINDHDWVVVGSTVDELLSMGFKMVGNGFPVFLHPETGDEYALARTEASTGNSYNDFSVNFSPDITLEEDLLRRDFTINSMAIDGKGKIIDPYGGLQDLENKVIRHTSNSFTEDPVRVLRAARFATQYAHLGFTIAPETIALMRSMHPLLSSLTIERVWKETLRALSEPIPSVYFYTLRDIGALGQIFPEIDSLFEVPQVATYHPEIDAGIHTMMSLDQAALLSKKISVRLAALLHDLGKGITPTEILPQHIGHEKAGVPIIESFCNRFKTTKNEKKLSMLVGLHHLNCHRANNLRPNTLLDIFEKIGAFRNRENLVDFIHACKADAKGRLGFENTCYPQEKYLLDCFDAAAKISGKYFYNLGLKGDKIKERLRMARINEIKKEIKNNLGMAPNP